MDDALEPALNAFAITFADRMPESETTPNQRCPLRGWSGRPSADFGVWVARWSRSCVRGCGVGSGAAARTERAVPQSMSLELAAFESGRARWRWTRESGRRIGAGDPGGQCRWSTAGLARRRRRPRRGQLL